MTTRVLVIEDEEDLVELLQTRVELADGLEIIGTHVGGLGVLELAAELQPDVIILDLMLPNPSGPRLIGLLRRACTARIYVWTAWDFLRDGLESDADGWFSKGQINQLLEHLDETRRA